MSRSRRRSPVNTGSSAKWYRRQENRRYRTRARQALRGGKDMPHPKSCGDPWSSPKDGNMGWWDRTWPGSLYDRKPWKLWRK